MSKQYTVIHTCDRCRTQVTVFGHADPEGWTEQTIRNSETLDKVLRQELCKLCTERVTHYSTNPDTGQIPTRLHEDPD